MSPVPKSIGRTFRKYEERYGYGCSLEFGQDGDDSYFDIIGPEGTLLHRGRLAEEESMQEARKERFATGKIDFDGGEAEYSADMRRVLDQARGVCSILGQDRGKVTFSYDRQDGALAIYRNEARVFTLSPGEENPAPELESLASLVQNAHANAVHKGFWTVPLECDSTEDQFPDIVKAAKAQHMALISTEVEEFEAALNRRSYEDALEEAADILIRVFDLVGFMGRNPATGVLVREDVQPRGSAEQIKREAGYKVALSVYRRVARATQADRKNHTDRRDNELDGIIAEVSRYVVQGWGPGALEQAIRDKMDKNASRAYKHGQEY